jgi:hypothetical protein
MGTCGTWLSRLSRVSGLRHAIRRPSFAATQPLGDPAQIRPREFQLPSPLALSHGHDQRNGEPWVLALLAAPLGVYRHARRLNMKKPPGDCAAWAASSIDQARL